MSNRKLTILISSITIVIAVYLLYLIYQTGIILGADPYIDRQIKALRNSEEAKTTFEGAFLDRKGTKITVPMEVGEAAECIYPREYSYIVGYNSPKYGLSGLRKWYADKLFNGGKDHKGADIQLTIDNDLQLQCYRLLGDTVGSIIVAECKTGKILSMVSRADEVVEFDVSLIDENFEIYNRINEFFYDRAILSEDPPGSIFKIVTATALLEEGLGELSYEDTGNYHGIKNAGNEVFGEITLLEAMKNSVNTYFAYSGDILGRERLVSYAEKYCLGKSIPLDFTVLTSSIGLDNNSNTDVAHTAFGQGNLMVSPMNLLMIIQAIANNGIMMKPMLVEKILDDGNEKVSDPEILGSVATDETISMLTEILSKTANEYGFSTTKYGTIIAKTGTAEVYDPEYNHTYLVFANEDYACVISCDRTNQTSHSLVTIAETLLNYIYQSEMEE